MILKRNFIFFIFIVSCHQTPKNQPADGHSCTPTNTRFSMDSIESNQNTLGLSKDGMVLIAGGSFSMGADDELSWRDEYPKHDVVVDSFWMDVHEVTNAQFSAFVEATGYETTAEKMVDWEEIKKELPPGTPKPNDSQLAPASLVFVSTNGPISLNNVSQWWQWKQGANWKQPDGPGSNIEGKEYHPVVHVSWFDANSYCEWAGKRLPTEAEWEYASRGGKENLIFTWGNEGIDSGNPKANTWNGSFPHKNTQEDGYYLSAPVKNYPPNEYGLYDMAGNVWEWCSDWYNEDYYKTLANKITYNPNGPKQSYDSNEPYAQKRVSRGGSFLCHESYCTGYRNSMRMKTTPDTGSIHTGFRAVANIR
jgi:formylglycine-generating enzyme required for sulfatase activity